MLNFAIIHSYFIVSCYFISISEYEFQEELAELRLLITHFKPIHSTMSATSNDTPSSINGGSNIPRPLTAAQERRLTDYLDNKLLEIQRAYKKRCEVHALADTIPLIPLFLPRNYETSTLRTLSSYIDAIHPLFTLVLMIPPLDSAVHLRASLLLRLTGEFLDCMPGYDPDDFNKLLDMLDEIDRGWQALLRSQVWDEKLREGVDTVLPPDTDIKITPISQTDRTRLRSLLISGTDKLEEWLEVIVSRIDAPDSETEAAELEELRQRFDDLFDATLAEMGEFPESSQ